MANQLGVNNVFSTKNELARAEAEAVRIEQSLGELATRETTLLALLGEQQDAIKAGALQIDSGANTEKAVGALIAKRRKVEDELELVRLRRDGLVAHLAEAKDTVLLRKYQCDLEEYDSIAEAHKVHVKSFLDAVAAVLDSALVTRGNQDRAKVLNQRITSYASTHDITQPALASIAHPYVGNLDALIARGFSGSEMLAMYEQRQAGNHDGMQYSGGEAWEPTHIDADTTEGRIASGIWGSVVVSPLGFSRPRTFAETIDGKK